MNSRAATRSRHRSLVMAYEGPCAAWAQRGTLTAPARRDDIILALGFRLLAATCFAFMAAMVKPYHDAGIGIVEIVYYHYIVAA